MRYKYYKGREKTTISYTSNDCLLRRESTRRINGGVQKSYQKSIAWAYKEQPIIKHHEKMISTKICQYLII